MAEREHDQDANTVRHEQELEVDVRSYEAGSVRARKHVEAKFVERVEPPRAVEQAPPRTSRPSPARPSDDVAYGDQLTTHSSQALVRLAPRA